MEVINEKQKKFAINFVLYIIAFSFICFIGISRAFAYSYTVIGDQANITVVLVSPDYSSQPFNVPINSSYNFNSVLQIDYIISNYNFDANKHYQLESHLTQQTLTNANTYSVIGYNGEQCLIDLSSSIFTGSYPRWDFQCPHATNTITLTIKNNANQYLWSNSGIYTWTSALLSYSTEPIPSSSTDTDTIINNNNQNTQNIINNNNQNTQDIINSNKVCSFIDKNNISIDNKVMDINGVLYDNSAYGITDYINISKSDLSITLVYNYNYWGANICYYTSNKTLISCEGLSNTSSLTIPNNAYYFRSTIYKYDNKPTYQICTDGNQALNDSINDLEDTINDDDTTDAENEASEFFNSFTTETFGLTSIITAPLNLIQSLLNTGAICNDLQLPLPFLDNKFLTLPCMYPIYREHFGTLFTMYQTITYGIIAYWVIVRIFNLVKDFKNPEHDEIEVMDL